MQFDDVILGRRSIRGYKPDPVPKALIAEIIGLAMRAPSSMNTQPWNFYVISGEPLDRIRAGNTERMVAGIPQSREFRTGQAFAGKHRDRQVGVAKQLFSAMGIERDNKDKRQDWVLRGFRQFDAPVCLPQLPPIAWIDSDGSLTSKWFGTSLSKPVVCDAARASFPSGRC
jgi:nitroreductase